MSRLSATVRRRRPPRNADFVDLLETFLVAAVATILVIRTQLWLTHYPQLGGHGLHIAHLLYGGLLMMITIGLLLTFLGRSPRRPAAVLGGIGFGFFIDELGKFITADNNYFFRPAAPLIYLIFIGLYLLIRRLAREGTLSPQERLANAIDLVSEAARRPWDRDRKQRALDLLHGAGEAGPLVGPVRRMVDELDALPPSEPPRVVRWARTVQRRYFALVDRPRFQLLVAAVFGIWALASLFSVLSLVLSVAVDWGGARVGFRNDDLAHLSTVGWATLISSAVSAVLVVIGLVRLRRGERLAGYRMLKDALLVAIFITRVFVFAESQFGAVFGLAVDLLLFITVRYMIGQEQRVERAKALERPEPAVA